MKEPEQMEMEFDQMVKEKGDELVNKNHQSLRLKSLLTIFTREKLDIAEDKSGIELNEGYQFEMNGAIPEIADGIAKMCVEMDKEDEFGRDGGKYFIQLINEYYTRTKGGN